MAQSHTWNFYLTAGRTWGGPRISGASITAYSTQTGSTVLKELVTNASGYTSYTLTGPSISPDSYFWRVNVGNIFGDYYNGKNIVGNGSQSGYYGIPSTIYNTKGIAHMSPNFNPLDINTTGTVTVYFFIVGNNVTIPSSKFLTWFDVLSLIPPTLNNLNSGSSIMTLNKCITESDMKDYQDKGAFRNSIRFNDSPDLAFRESFQEFSSFITGTSAAPSLSTTSLAFSCDDYSPIEQHVNATVPNGFTINTSITGTYKNYFTATISQTNSTTFQIAVSPTNSNHSDSVRTASLIVGISKIDSDAWFGGSMTSATVTITQQYYASSGGSSGSTGGGGTGGGGSQT